MMSRVGVPRLRLDGTSRIAIVPAEGDFPLTGDEVLSSYSEDKAR